MITKINSGIATIAKRPIRANLQKASAIGLGILAGSSMSGWHGPHFEPTEMIIPDGLTFPEKAYYLLKGKLPHSVYERWFPQTDDYVPSQGDQVVTVDIVEGQYIGEIVKAPHKVKTFTNNDSTISHEQDISDDIANQSSRDFSDISNDDNTVGCGQDISEDIANAISGDVGNISNNDEDSSLVGEFLKHLFNADS